jgi:hypothetical protein
MFNSTIEYLLHRRDPVENEFTRSLSRLKASSDLDKLSVLDGDAGAVSKFVHMEAESGRQMVSRNNYQKATTYMQLQEEAIKYANILYSEMASLALRATDPNISDSERDVLSKQFAGLREIALDLNHSHYADNYLFEERAATTDFEEQANWDLYWKRIDDGIHKDITTENFIAESIYNAPVKTGVNAVPVNIDGQDGFQVTQDVVYNKGNILIQFNPGNRGERLQVIQGDPNGTHRILLDTFEWKTRGEAYNFDYDIFELSYADEELTTLNTHADISDLWDDGMKARDNDHVPFWYYYGIPSELGSQKDSNLQTDKKMSLWSNVPNRTNHINGTWDSGDPDREDGKYNLWQNTHYDWVRDDDIQSKLKEAVLEAKEINPALRTPSDLYKKIGSAGTGGEEDYNANFAISERSAIYQLGGLQFIAKHPDISNDSDYDFETANGYSVEIQDNQSLLPKQVAQVKYGTGSGDSFVEELSFKVKDTDGLKGFDGNQALLEFSVDPLKRGKYKREDQRENSEKWLEDNYASSAEISGITLWAKMQDGQKIKDDYLDTEGTERNGSVIETDKNRILGKRGDKIKIVIEEGSAKIINGTITVSESGSVKAEDAKVTISLSSKIKHTSTDKAEVDNHGGLVDHQKKATAEFTDGTIKQANAEGALGNGEILTHTVWYDADGNTTTEGADDAVSSVEETLTASDGESNLYYYQSSFLADEIGDNRKFIRKGEGVVNNQWIKETSTTNLANGSNEDFVKYEEVGKHGKFLFSRKIETSEFNDLFKDYNGQDGFTGYTQQHVKAAWDRQGTSKIFSEIEMKNSSANLKTNEERWYTSYSVRNVVNKEGEAQVLSAEPKDDLKAKIHTEDNLNKWMGRDKEEVTYEEDVSSKKITIKLSGTEATPDEVARAYTAYINTKTLDEFDSDDAAYKRTDLSTFMAPAVLDQTKISGGGTPTPLVQEIVGKESGAGGSGSWNRASEYDKLETEKASENIAMSNNLTVRVLQGERNLGADSGRPVDDEDSYQLKVHYRPPEKDETETVGGESDLQVPILALGLGLLRDSQKVEFDVGGLHLEAESAGTFKLDIIRDPSLSEVTVKESGFTIQIKVPDYSTPVEDIVTKVNDYGGRFSASGSGSLGINSRKIESNTGYYGKAISFSNAEEAQRAFENMTREISDLAEQVDQLAQNMSKVNMSADHVNRQIAIRKDMGKEVTEGVLQGESIAIKEFEILRDYHMSLLHKVMRVNEDMVRMLVLK